MMTNTSDNVVALIERARRAEKSEDAMRFAQAATNAANALMCLESLKRAEIGRP